MVTTRWKTPDNELLVAVTKEGVSIKDIIKRFRSKPCTAYPTCSCLQTIAATWYEQPLEKRRLFWELWRLATA